MNTDQERTFCIVNEKISGKKTESIGRLQEFFAAAGYCYFSE